MPADGADWQAVMREACVRGLTPRDALRLWVERGGRRTSYRRVRAGLAEARVACRDKLVERIASRNESLVGVYEMAAEVYRLAMADGDLKSALAALREIRTLAEDQKKGALLDLSILNLPSGGLPDPAIMPTIVDASPARNLVHIPCQEPAIPTFENGILKNEKSLTSQKSSILDHPSQSGGST